MRYGTRTLFYLLQERHIISYYAKHLKNNWINKKGEIHRYEIGDIKIGDSYIYKDAYPPFQGIEYTRLIKNHNVPL